nr:hypothetical protein [Tanacetum cinerariifolium]
GVRVVNLLPLDFPELRHPRPYEIAIFIELLALQQRIEHVVVGLRIYACATCKAPAAVVDTEIAVDEFQHKVLLAQSPVKEQVL